MKLVSPHIDPTQEMMNASQRTMLFLMLKKDIPKYTEHMMEMAKAMDTRVKLAYKDGPMEAFAHWDKFAKDKENLMQAANMLMQELAKFERRYLTWMAEVHGERAVIDKLGLTK